MIFHSSSSSGPGLLTIVFGTAILPTSCSSAPNSTSRRSSSLRPISSAISSDSAITPKLCSPVYSSSATITSPSRKAVPR